MQSRRCFAVGVRFWGKSMDGVFRLLLGRFIQRGTIIFTTAGGTTFTCGDGTGEPVHARLTSPLAQRRLLLDPELALGEIYMDGGLVMQQGSIADLLAVAMGQPDWTPRWAKLHGLVRYWIRTLHQFNPRSRSRNNVAHHYDLDGRLYALFLDSDKQYSCAYFETPDASLDDAQLAKKRHVAAKLLTTPGQRVLDIGSGWGGLGLYLAETCGADVTGVQMSPG